jgi:hypothetical protein
MVKVNHNRVINITPIIRASTSSFDVFTSPVREGLPVNPVASCCATNLLLAIIFQRVPFLVVGIFTLFAGRGPPALNFAFPSEKILGLFFATRSANLTHNNYIIRRVFESQYFEDSEVNPSPEASNLLTIATFFVSRSVTTLPQSVELCQSMYPLARAAMTPACNAQALSP